MFFDRNNELNIFSNTIPNKFIKNCFKKFPDNLPEFLKTLPKKYEGDDTTLYRYKSNLRSDNSFLNIFRRSVAFCSPWDIQVNIDRENNKIFGSIGQSNEFKFENFVKDQNKELFLNYVKEPVHYDTVIELHFDLYLQSEHTINCNSPWWHFNVEYETMPLVYNCKEVTEFVIKVPVKKQYTSFVINKGDFLSYLTPVTDKNVILNFKDKKINKFDIDDLNYNFKNLNKKLLNNL